MPLDEVVSTMYPAWFTECANLYRVMYSVDREGVDIVRGGTSTIKIKTEWLDPQLDRVAEWEKQSQEMVNPQSGTNFVLVRYKMALDSLVVTIDKYKTK